MVFALAVTAMFAGCGNSGPVDKETFKYEKPVVEVSDTSKFTTSEKDAFNPANGIESARKKRPTKFGRLATLPRVQTPDEETINANINSVGKTILKVGNLIEGTIDLPSFPFDYENDSALLTELYKLHNLESVIKKSMTSLEVAQALNIYTYNFFEGGTEPSKETWMKDTVPSAFAMTAAKRDKNIGGRSENYAAFLCQLSLTCGFVSRITGMHTVNENGEIVQHAVCEIFLSSHDKWAVFDPYAKATYYLRDGLPLSAMEIRNLMLANLLRDISPIIGVGDFSDIVSVREKHLPVYKNIYIWRMNDILGKSGRSGSISWQELFQSHLVWEDPSSLVVSGKYDQLDTFTNNDNAAYPLNGVKYVAHDLNDMYWKVNQTVIHVERLADEKLRMYVDSFTPNFDHFEFSYVEENNSRAIKTTNGVITINMNVVDLTVGIINAFNVPSRPVQINIALP